MKPDRNFINVETGNKWSHFGQPWRWRWQWRRREPKRPCGCTINVAFLFRSRDLCFAIDCKVKQQELTALKRIFNYRCVQGIETDATDWNQRSPRWIFQIETAVSIGGNTQWTGRTGPHPFQKELNWIFDRISKIRVDWDDPPLRAINKRETRIQHRDTATVDPAAMPRRDRAPIGGK